MRPFVKSLALVALILMSAPASAQYASNRTVMGRLDSLERNLMLMQRQMASGGGSVDGVPMSDAGAASLQVQMSEMEESIRSLQGMIEQSQHETSQVKGELDRLSKDIDFRLQALEQKAATAPQPMAAAPEPETIQQEAANIPVETIDTTSEAAYEEEPVPVNRSGANPTPQRLKLPGEQTPPDLNALKFSSPNEHYHYAYGLLNRSKYEEAQRAFNAFIKQYPKDPLIGNSWYWLGETYYVKRDFVKAADSFRQGFEALPRGPKAADNLLKLSLSLNAQGNKDDACVTLRHIVSKFGKSSTSIKQKAEAEIDRLNCQ